MRFKVLSLDALENVVRHLGAKPRAPHWRNLVGPMTISILLQLGGDITAATRRAFNELKVQDEFGYDETAHGMPYSENQRRVLSLLSCLGSELHRIELAFLPGCAANAIATHCTNLRHLSLRFDYKREAASFNALFKKCGRRLDVLELEAEKRIRRDVVVLAENCTTLRRLKLKVTKMDCPLAELWKGIGNSLRHLEAENLEAAPSPLSIPL